MDTKYILVDDPAPGVRRVRLNRPEKRNAMNATMRAEILAALRAADADPQVRVSILCGAGPDFSAGYDLTPGSEQERFGGLGSGPGRFQRAVVDGWTSIWDLDKPVIAQVHELHDDGVALAIFPELGLSGYAIDDLLLQDPLLDAVDEALGRICEATADLRPIVVVGAPLVRGSRLYNCAVVIQGGGIIGVAIVGIQRALFSSAAGVGSAGMAHAASKTTKPATEGFVAMWEPLIDSVIICTLTSLAIITTGLYTESTEDGIGLTAQAFGEVSSWFPYLLTIAVVLFAFSTILAYGYYGQQALGYLTKNSKAADKAYQIFWILAVIVGASMSLDSVIAFSDAIFFLMAFPNLLGIYFLARILRLEILRLRKRIDAGVMKEITPVELQVGMGDHEPTPEQIRAAEAGRRRKRDKLRDVRDTLRRKKLERKKAAD